MRKAGKSAEAAHAALELLESKGIAEVFSAPAERQAMGPTLVKCESCGWEFIAAHTSGVCPLCHWQAPSSGAALSRSERASVWIRTGANGLLVGVVGLAAVFAVMFGVVFWMFMRG